MKTESILAKSSPKQSLKEHIQEGIELINQLAVLFPNIERISNQPDFWKIIKDSVVLHDIGKSHLEFQKVLNRLPNNWNYQRHELFSLPFVEGVDSDFRDLIYWVVAGHHKDFETLRQRLRVYAINEQNNFGLDLEGTASIPTFEEEFNTYVQQKEAIALLEFFGIRTRIPVVFNPMKRIEGFIKENNRSPEYFLKVILLAGAFKECDHLASAGIKEIYQLNSTDFSYLHNNGYNFYTHQSQSAKQNGNVLLRAPTGSGKTEASLLWLQNQLANNGLGRVFYVLPFTASINAMYERIERNLQHKAGLLHGKLAAYIENKFEDDPNVTEEDKQVIKDQFKTLITPFKIVTPFQLLKNIFTVKGYEKGIFEWSGAYFIFDEIHAYDPKVFAQIIALLKFVTQKLHAHAFVMTATLPEFLRSEIHKALGKSFTIYADENLYQQFNRHRIKLKDGLLSEHLTLIQKYINDGRKVLVVCNTVEQAQTIYGNLVCEEKTLVHGRFNAKDRMVKERSLKNDENQLLVGTQAIEVSLDIDYDIILTEPAPLDALIQRFGRVNRKRKKGICDCIVFKERNESDRFIYRNKGVVDRTLEILEKKQQQNSGIIKEIELQEMMNFVYPIWDKDDKNEYDKILELLDSFIQNDLKPFMHNQSREDDFYSQFDGIKVVPSVLINEYQDLLRKNKFIKAENLKVSITTGKYHQLKTNYPNAIELRKEVFERVTTGKIIDKNVLVINRMYDDVLGLQMDKEKFVADEIIW